jgi:hypothetical protein
MTSRSLLPTPVNDLLLDPFITADTSWGHFRVMVPAVTPAETGGDCPYIQRELVSASPTGVSGPAVLVNPTSLPASTGCTAILAPFVGSTETVNAQIWVSLSDSSGAPLPFPTATDAGASTVDGFLSVALIPNVLPATATPPNSYPLTLTTSAAVVLAGRSWGRLALASPVAIPDGGWFSITLSNGENGLYLAGPQVVPTASAQVAPRPGALAGRPITEAERGAVLQYGRLIRSRPRLRKHGR